MSQPNVAPSSNGQAKSEFLDRSKRTVDWSGYPTLFQRVGHSVHSESSRSVEIHSPSPEMGMQHTARITEAFQAFCQAALLSPSSSFRHDLPSEATAARRAIAAARAFGFTLEDIRRLGCGLYSGPAAVREDLRSIGFTEAEIGAAQLVCDSSGRPRVELAGCLIVPLSDERGYICDFLCVTVDEKDTLSGYCFLYGAARSEIVAYGLQAAMSHPGSRESLTLVDDVLETLFLQSQGVPHVAAIGATGSEFTPRRWEELARLGIRTVTLAFRQDDRHATNVRDVLVSALRARTAPEVFVAKPFPGSERSAADVLRRFGKEACSKALAARALAFHDKDFGAADYERRAFTGFYRKAAPAVSAPESSDDRSETFAEPHFRDAFRKHLSELVAALPVEERKPYTQFVSAFDAAVSSGNRQQAKWLLERPHYVNSAEWEGWKSSHFPFGMHVQNHGRHFSVVEAADVLDRVRNSSQPAGIPPYLRDDAGHESRSSVEWIVETTPRRRLSSLCERIIDASERRPSESFLVVCCEHSERQIMLTLVAHLASRLSTGPGLSVLDVEARLTGSEPPQGYCNKPWLIDEAADRIRIWSSRLTFLTSPRTMDGHSAVEQIVGIAHSRSCVGGLFFDALPMGAATPLNAHDANWVATLVSRFSGTITIATPVFPMSWPAYWSYGWPGIETHSAWPRNSVTGRQIFATLNDWLRREEEAASN